MNRDGSFERETESLFRRLLRENVKIYSASDTSNITGRREHFEGFYGFGGATKPSFNGSYFGFVVDNNICDIIEVELNPRFRGHGVGRGIYNCVEKFSREMGVKRLELSALGDGKTFWLHLGFVPVLCTNQNQELIEMYKEIA